MSKLELFNIPDRIHDRAMEKSPVTRARDVAGPPPLIVRRVHEKPLGSPRPEKVPPLLQFNQPGKPWPVATGRPLRLPTDSPVQYFLGGAASLAIWVVLWLLMALTFVGRFERQQPVARPRLVTGSASSVGPSPACSPGLIELDGRCVPGEEIDVRPPPGWRRR